MENLVINDAQKRELLNIRQWVRDELERCVQFWLGFGLDREYGGILTCLTRSGEVYSSDKSVWMQGRAAWTFSYLCRNYGRKEEWMEAARSCLDFLEAHCKNKSAKDRLYFTVTREGLPLRQRRYNFSEGFYAIANAEYYGLSQDPIYLERARKAYQMVWDLNHGAADPTGLGPKTIASTRQSRALADPMIFLNMTSILRRFDLDPEWQKKYEDYARSCVHDILEYHIKDDLRAALETVGLNGEFQKNTTAGRMVNPGHDMECCWFLLEEANRAGDQALKKKTEDLYRYAWDIGWDKEYGGLLYMTDCLGYPPEAYEHDMKLWWPHNETLISSLMLFRDTGKSCYYDRFKQVIEYCQTYFADPEYGEWFGYLRRDGKPTEPPCKGSTFKGPFHVPRSLTMIDKIIGELVKED